MKRNVAMSHKPFVKSRDIGEAILKDRLEKSRSYANNVGLNYFHDSSGERKAYFPDQKATQDFADAVVRGTFLKERKLRAPQNG